MSRSRPLQILTLLCGLSVLLLAAGEPKQRVLVSKTERMDFPPNATLRLANSVGVVTVEAWDGPGVEITTTKSTKVEYEARDREKAIHELDNVHITAERHGDELVIATTFRRRAFPPPYPFDKRIAFYPLTRDVNFDLEYRIKVPRNGGIVVNHAIGEVNIDGIAGDIQVTLLRGEIMLHLPEEERRTIHASSKFGHVDSDFPGQQKRRGWITGHRVVYKDSAAAHKLNLKVGNGNIVILKTRVPKTPEPAVRAVAREARAMHDGERSGP